MKKLMKSVGIAALLWAPSLPAFANGVVAVQSAERQVIQIDENGNEVVSFEPADLVSPGDVVRFTIAYENNQDVSVEDAVLVMPIPETMTFINIKDDAEAGRQDVRLSYDLGQTYWPEGKFPDDYDSQNMPVTHIKWQFLNPIAGQSKGSVSAFTRLK